VAFTSASRTSSITCTLQTSENAQNANFAVTEFSEVSWQAKYHEKVIRRLQIHAGLMAFIYARGAMATKGRKVRSHFFPLPAQKGCQE
jgi:hypothetical protein